MVAIAVAAALLGCGSDDDSSASGAADGSDAPPITKAEFVKQANAICTKGKKKALEGMQKYAKAHSEDSDKGIELLAEAVQAVYIPQIGNQVEELRALGIPEGDEEQVEAFLDAMQEAVDAESDNSPASTSFSDSFKRPAELARAYGLDACAYSG